MRARNGLMGRSEVSEVIGALSRTEGCWTFNARDRMPRPSRATSHHPDKSALTAMRAPLPRAGSFIGAEQPPRLHPRKSAVRRKQSLSTMQANCRVRPEGVALKTFASRCSGRRKAAIHSGSHQLTAACRATPLPLSDPRYRPPRISRLFARSPVAVAGAIASDRETPYPFRACRDT